MFMYFPSDNVQEAVEGDKPPVWKKREKLPKVTRSFHNFMVKDVVQDFAAQVLQVRVVCLSNSLFETEISLSRHLCDCS